MIDRYYGGITLIDTIFQKAQPISEHPQQPEGIARGDMRVIVADDEAQVRSALRLLLEHEKDIEIVFETGTLAGLLEQMGDLCPDVLLLDWDMRLPVLNGPMLQMLRHHCPSMRILALSGRPESRAQALQSGAHGFISKADPPERLLEAVRATSTQLIHLTNHEQM